MADDFGKPEAMKTARSSNICRGLRPAGHLGLCQLPGHTLATLSSGTEEASFSHHLHTATGFYMGRAWFVLGDVWPRTSIGVPVDLHAHCRPGKAPGFSLGSCFNAVFHKVLQIFTTSSGRGWAQMLGQMNDRSRTLRALAQEEMYVVLALHCLHALELALGSPYPALIWTTHLHRQRRSRGSCTQGSPSGHLAVVTVSESSSQVLS